MVLLWSACISVGLWLLFPKAFKFWVGCFVGTAGGMFFWSLAGLVWCMVVGLPSWAAMGYSMLAFIIAGNVVGFVCALKG